MSGEPRIAVVVPSYNRPERLRDCLEALMRLDGPGFEIVVVDDGSRDGTAEIVRSFEDPRLRLLQNRECKGIGFCHNREFL